LNGSSVGGTSIYPQLVQQVACGDGGTFGAVTDAGPCDVFAMARRLQNPAGYYLDAGVQRVLSSKLSLDVAYVGNHGSKLTGIQDINQPALGSGWTPFDIINGVNADGNEQLTRPFNTKYPYLGYINFYSNLYRSNYNGLQATFTGRNYHGLDFVAGYTYSHTLDDQSYNWNQYLPKDSLNPNGEYGASDFDIRHRFTLSVTYASPARSRLRNCWKAGRSTRF